VLLAGFLEFFLVGGAAARAGVLPRFAWPRIDPEVMLFLKRFWPATVGSAGTQIALFADTIIASFLATGALSALYYADRLNQLPIGVIGIAAGTVLLPEMARRITAGDEAGASHSQNRAIELTLLLSVPCLVAFVAVPEPIMRGLFSRGAFTVSAAHASALTLMAYAIGLLPFVLVRSVSAAFLSRGDTATPVKALFVGVVVNVALKILLMDRYAQVGLAFATSIGAWINLALLAWLSARRGFLHIDTRLRRSSAKFAIAGVVLGAALLLCEQPLGSLFGGWSLHNEMTLLVLGVIGVVVYGVAIWILFRHQWRDMMSRTRQGRGVSPDGSLQSD
jgi:putative peptidoglycan lipid II flippase